MKTKIIYIGAFLLTSLSAFAQKGTARLTDWVEKPQMHEVPPKYFGEHAIQLLHSIKLDYVFDGYELAKYRTLHFRYKVLDRAGVQALNHVELPLGTEIDTIKARTILPDGTVKNVNYDMLHVKKSFDGYKLVFAMDAVEKNAEIELLIRDLTYTSFFGSYEMQSNIPVLHTFFELNYPRELSFQVKGYHGFPTAKDSLYGGKKHIKIYAYDIPPLDEEEFANYDQYCMRLDYRIDHILNRNNQKVDEFSWNDYAENLYNRYYLLGDSDKRAAVKFLAFAGVKGTESEVVKIRKIEEAIKKGVVKSDIMEEESGANLDSINKHKVSSSDGIMKLFASCLLVAGIRHEIGFTTSRDEAALDLKFPNWSVLDYPLFYFPDQDAYLAPLAEKSRFPSLPSGLSGNKAIFCKTDVSKDYVFGRIDPKTGTRYGSPDRVAEAIIRKTPLLSHTENVYDLYEHITFNDKLEPTAEIKKSITGYRALGVRYDIKSLTPENTKETLISYLPLIERKDRLLKYGMENVDATDTKKPVILTATVFAPFMMDKAGGRNLVKVGMGIGNTRNLYDQVKPRVLPLDIEYPYTSNRTIVIDLPAGARKPENLSAFRKNVEHTDPNTGDVTAWFRSDYTLNGNKLTITVNEVFTRTHYPVYDYERIKPVFNAAADFHDAVLLFEGGNKPKAGKKSGAPHATARK